ncbi:hypothetical protein [Jiella sonneratiae]|uniref:PAS domain-containing protein n=1 Tax=Jiella sonneratiae TaxID=2816856 RepID=A0ABS3J166_9HYPH|nr:hypothetical protein [Jiella sonneratiae]MBO0903399.1 hypothetical protein [Jiella sonneratiae]
MLLQFPGRLDLVRERVGQASLCPSSWTPLLAAIDRILPGVESRLQRFDRNVARRGVTVRRVLSVANRTRLRYSDGGWQDECFPSLERGTIFRFDELERLARPELSSGEGKAGAGLILHDGAQQSWSLTLTVPAEAREAMLPTATALLQRLAEDLVPAFLVSHATGSPDQPTRDVIEGAWDHLSAPVVLLTRDMVIEASNVAAEDLLHETRYFRPRFFDDRLNLASREDELALEAAIGRLARRTRKTARVTLNGLRRSPPLSIRLQQAGSPVWRQQFVPELADTGHVLAIFAEAD